MSREHEADYAAGVRHRVELLLWALSAYWSSGGCARPPEQIQRPVGVSQPPAASTFEPAPPPRETPKSRGTFECGKEQCRLGEASCCTGGEVSFCAPNAPADPPTSPQLLGNQIEACTKLSAEGSVSEIARCRSSSHCADGELCCDESLFSGASAIICVPALPSELACNYGEVCTADQPCRSPGAHCIKGRCRKSTTVACGKTDCNLATHTCLITNAAKSLLECKSDAELAAAGWMGPTADIACASHSDCLPGERCRLTLGRTFCQRADDGMTALMCDKASDCGADFCAGVGMPQKKPVCARDPDFWHTTCDCR